MTKKSRQKFKYLENKNSISDKIKVKCFINFQGFLFAKICQRPDTEPLDTLAIKRGLSCNFTKNFKGHPFYGK